MLLTIVCLNILHKQRAPDLRAAARLSGCFEKIIESFYIAYLNIVYDWYAVAVLRQRIVMHCVSMGVVVWRNERTVGSKSIQ